MAKNTFRLGAFADLRAVSGERGEPLLLPLDQIDEDPDQPRTKFDAAEMAKLEASARIVGILQPVGVRPQPDGRYRLVFGARRVRAAANVGLTEVPAVIVGENQTGLTAQVIENQARAALPNSDLAAVVERLTAEKRTIDDIAAICAMPKHQVSFYRGVPNFQPPLRERLDHADIRALYDLYRAWPKDPKRFEAALPGKDAYLTITEARRIIEAVTGRTTHSIAIARGSDAAGSRPDPAPEQAPSPPPPAAKGRGEKSASAVDPAPPSPSLPAASKPPVFVVEAEDGRRGNLVTDRKPRKAANALVDFPEGVVELACADLRLVAVR